MKAKLSMTQEQSDKYFDRQYGYIDRNIKQLIGIYGGKFVIIYNEMVVDSDSNELELAKRKDMRHKFDFKLPALSYQVPRTLEEYFTARGEKKEKYPYAHFESPESR